MLFTMRIGVAACLLFATGVAFAQEENKAKVTVIVRGMISERDAAAVAESLKNVPAIEFDASSIEQGAKGPFGHFYSPPFELTLNDLQTTDIGGVAKAVSETRTPSRNEIEPSLSLVFFHPDGRVDEEDISNFRQTLVDVNGLEPQVAGGVGGAPSEGRLWIRLEAAGGANLPLILDALNRNNLRLNMTQP